jgi:hypothetical protein
MTRLQDVPAYLYIDRLDPRSVTHLSTTCRALHASVEPNRVRVIESWFRKHHPGLLILFARHDVCIENIMKDGHVRFWGMMDMLDAMQAMYSRGKGTWFRAKARSIADRLVHTASGESCRATITLKVLGCLAMYCATRDCDAFRFRPWVIATTLRYLSRCAAALRWDMSPRFTNGVTMVCVDACGMTARNSFLDRRAVQEIHTDARVIQRDMLSIVSV